MAEWDKIPKVKSGDKYFLGHIRSDGYVAFNSNISVGSLVYYLEQFKLEALMVSYTEGKDGIKKYDN